MADTYTDEFYNEQGPTTVSAGPGVSFENSAWFNPVAAFSNFFNAIREDGIKGAFFGTDRYPTVFRALANDITGHGNDRYSDSDDPYLSDAERIISTMEAAEDKANAFNLNSAREAMKFEHDEAKEYRDWLEYMSNTEISRAIQQLRANGLNPALAYSNPASTPSGAMAHGFSAQASSQQRSSENISLSTSKMKYQLASAAVAAITAVATRGLAVTGGSARDIGFTSKW